MAPADGAISAIPHPEGSGRVWRGGCRSITSPVSRFTIFAPSPACAAARAAHFASSSSVVLTSRLPCTRISNTTSVGCGRIRRSSPGQFGKIPVKHGTIDAKRSHAGSAACEMSGCPPWPVCPACRQSRGGERVRSAPATRNRQARGSDDHHINRAPIGRNMQRKACARRLAAGETQP